jgi:hypothetical protein
VIHAPYKILVKNLEKKRRLRDLGVCGRIILKLFSKKLAVRVVELFSGTVQVPCAGFYGHGARHLGYKRGRNSLFR